MIAGAPHRSGRLFPLGGGLVIALAYPTSPAHREQLRKILDVDALPAMYRQGAKDLPCAACGLTLNVGPRLQERLVAARLLCPVCAEYECRGLEVELHDLGNPESRTEGESVFRDTKCGHAVRYHTKEICKFCERDCWS